MSVKILKTTLISNWNSTYDKYAVTEYDTESDDAPSVKTFSTALECDVYIRKVQKKLEESGIEVNIIYNVKRVD